MTSRPATATTLAAALAEDIRIAELKRLELQRQEQREAEEQKKLLDEQQRQQILLQGTDVGRDKSTHNGAHAVVDVPATAAANPALILKPVIKTLLTPPSTTATTTADISPAKVQGPSPTSLSTNESNLTPNSKVPELFHPGADVRTDGDGPAAAIVLLIDKLTATSVVRNGETRETFRLWLSDGDISIQGLFRHGALDLLIDGTLVEGSYVQINEFEILQQPRISGNGTVLILLASEAASVGHDGRNGLPAFVAADVQQVNPSDESSMRLQDTEDDDEDDQEFPNPIAGISPYYKRSVRSNSILSSTLPGGNAYVPISISERAETESVHFIPSPTAHKQSTPSVSSTPTPTPRHKRKAQEISEVGSGSQQPLSQLDANQRPGSRGWPRKKQRLQDQMSPEKALKFHSDAFLEKLKAIQASPSKMRQGTDAQTTLSPIKEGEAASKSSPVSSQNSATTVPFSPSPQKTKSQEARRQQRLSEVFSPSKVKKSPAKKPPVKLNPKVAGMISSLPNPSVASEVPPHSQRNPSINLPPSAQRPVSSLEPRPQSSSSTPHPPKPIARPVKLVPLSSVTGANACRSKIIDVLVVISHVNPRLLVRSGFPNSRELLVMDRSTTKQVHLTVFVDAAHFDPPPGTVALMRNITTHEYGGGSLKAYFQRCVGVQWFIPEGDIGRGWLPGEWDDEADDLRKFWLECDEARTVPEGTWWTERGAARFQRAAQ